ncbi:DUF4142 domain-containing protein [Oligoflexus sp.]|uniref:DUF4142 domain-containing protein n=1 Tax=Oligoflexus sp. TaxID=1971216 RepID=UPI002D79A347|nr:DUF4142 domain-containing protein [Oligoflexus sp.]
MMGLCWTAQAHEGTPHDTLAAGSDQLALEVDEAEAIGSAEVLQKIHANNLAEIDMGQMIMDRGNSEDLRKYGRILVRDHLIMDGMVNIVAKGLGVELDGASVNDDVAGFKESLIEMNEMLAATTSDEEFRAMLRAMAIESHQAALDLLRRAEKGAPDLSLRLLAKTSDPVISRHLQLAKEI